MNLYFHQVNVGIGLLTTVRKDLQNVISVCEQVKKPTNYLRSVMSDLMKGMFVYSISKLYI
jgi:dynein heavy chain 1